MSFPRVAHGGEARLQRSPSAAPCCLRRWCSPTPGPRPAHEHASPVARARVGTAAPGGRKV
eukprot:3621604-Alexandrium_andersonii.AAC.1